MNFALILAATAQMAATTFLQVDYPGAQAHEISVPHRLISHTEGQIGSLGGPRIALPKNPPPLTLARTHLSPMMRARDVEDISRYPARAVAKLFQLNADGTHAKAACTAQFVGPRYLVTAGHCIMDVTTGTPHAGFEVAASYDDGESRGGVAKVVHAWVGPGQEVVSTITTVRRGQAPPTAVTPDRCSDYAVLEIDRPLGATTGWLGLRDRDPPSDPENDAEPVFRFSYPHLSSVQSLSGLLERKDLAPAVHTAVEKAAKEALTHEPEFSPANLYFEYGTADLAEGRFIADRTGEILPGRSGAALLNGDDDIVAIMSRAYSGVLYNCRLTSDEIGAIAALIARKT